MTSSDAIKLLKEAICKLEKEEDEPYIKWRTIECKPKCDFIWTNGHAINIEKDYCNQYTKYTDNDYEVDLDGIPFADKVTFNCRYAVPDGRVFGWIVTWFLRNGYQVKEHFEGKSWLLQFVKKRSC